MVSLLLTLNEGYPSRYQQVIDSLFHNWLITGSAAVMLWLARRGTLGTLPSPLRGLSTLVMTYFAMVSTVAVVASQLFWDVLKPFGVVQKIVQPAAVLGLVWLWGICLLGLFIRGIIRWFRGRYEHHGIAVGVGPVYFYFRRRRTS